MSACRDCSRPTPASARSCPHCGILNPVVQWVAYPDGSHLTARLAPDPVAAAAALSGKPAPRPAAPRPLALSRPASGSSMGTGASASAGSSAYATGASASTGSSAYGSGASGATEYASGTAAFGTGTSAAPDPFAMFAPGGAPPLPLGAAPADDSSEEVSAINRCSTAFYWLAGLNAVVGWFFRDVMGNGLLLDAAIMGGLSFALRHYRSRVAAVLLVLYAGFTVYSKTMALLDGNGAIGWIWLWVLVTVTAGRAALATFKLHDERPTGAFA